MTRPAFTRVECDRQVAATAARPLWVLPPAWTEKADPGFAERMAQHIARTRNDGRTQR